MTKLTMGTFGLAAAMAALPASSTAQLARISTRAAGMGDAYTAAARGFEAIRWNPAMLGMPGQPSFSLNVLQAELDFGSNTFSLGDFQKYRNEILSDADKDTILAMVRERGVDRPLTLEAGAGVSLLSLTLGNFGFAITGRGEVRSAMASDAVELALFGNVTRTSPGDVYDASGSSAAGLGSATFAVAYGTGIPVPIGTFAVGATLKYTQGVGVLYVESINTRLRTSPTFRATAGAHALVSDVDNSTSNGSGFGLDLGSAYQLPGGLRFGLTIENFFNNTSWNDDNLVYYNKQFLLDEQGDGLLDSTIVDIDKVAYSPNDPAQAALRDSIDQFGTYPRNIRGGVAFETGPLTLTGDLAIRVSDGLGFGAGERMGAGAELHLAVVSLRFGLATAFQNALGVHGGVGLNLGPLRLDVAASNTTAGERKGFVLATGISIN